MAKIKSSYQMGWLIVMFDLPTDTKKERRAAARFRNDLLDRGYLMFQYSVYVRCAVTLDRKKHFIAELEAINPETGNIKSVFITDRQWGDVLTISAGTKKHRRSIENQTGIGEQLQFW